VMNCAYHADRPVQGVCHACGRPICDQCLVDLGGQVYCKACLEARVRQPAREINGFVRLVLSAFPGLGHLYMGLLTRGFQIMIGGIAGLIVIGALVPPLLGVLIPGLIFFSVFDAREAHLRLRQGLEVEDREVVNLSQLKLRWNPRYVGWALIIIGAASLYETLLDDVLGVLIRDWQIRYQLVSAIRGATLGVLGIGAGLWLLRREPRA
jgi:hypothetical protein